MIDNYSLMIEKSLKKKFLSVVSFLDTIHVRKKIFFTLSQFEKLFRWPHLNGLPCVWKTEKGKIFYKIRAIRVFTISEFLHTFFYYNLVFMYVQYVEFCNENFVKLFVLAQEY